ncbi:translation elongation factor-like protein [Candidatus Woesearchaeota archaeon]|nr:translation elongation factor-like protein [Candidatus Woesearchaeota archaeon]
MAEEIKIGIVFSYFSKAGVAAIKLTDGGLKVGDTIHIKGNTTDFSQKVESIQIEHEILKEAEHGQDIGIKVNEKVRSNDIIYKIVG